jgi:nucleolar complex protein 3
MQSMKSDFTSVLLVSCQALFEVFFRVLKHCSASTTAYKQQLEQQLTQQQQQHDACDASAPSSSYNSSSSSSTDALFSPWPASKVQKKFPLLQPVLEGLGRYSHLISVDYFNDLMAVLQEVGAMNQP